jgi:hypothetical protein
MVPRDVLAIIFGRALSQHVVLVCRAWTLFIADMIYSGEYSDIIKSRAPPPLPAACFPWLTIEQAVRFSCTIRLKHAYSISWVDIMSHCHGRRDVDWLLDPQWSIHYNTRRKIYKLLFGRYKQFRDYIASFTFTPTPFWSILVVKRVPEETLDSISSRPGGSPWIFTGRIDDMHALDTDDRAIVNADINTIMFNNDILNRTMMSYSYHVLNGRRDPSAWHQTGYADGSIAIALPCRHAALCLPGASQ